MVIDLKSIMVDLTKIEVITPMLNRYQSSGVEYKIQVGGIVYRIDERDYPRDILIKKWQEIVK